MIVAEMVEADAIETRHLKAESITGQKIAALTIEGGHIKAGSISAADAVFQTGAIVDANIANLNGDKLFANSISAKQMVLGSFDNLVQDPNFDKDFGVIHGPPVGDATGNGGTFDIYTPAAGVPRAGTRVLRYRSAGQTNTATMYLNGDANNGGQSPRAVEGDTFYFDIWVRLEVNPASGKVPRVRVGVQSRKAGTYIGVTYSDFITPTTSWQRVKVATTPSLAGTEYITPIIQFITAADGTYSPDAVILLDTAYARRMVDDVLIGDGTISVPKLKAGAMSVGQYIESSGYVAGSSGWRIDGNGDVEFASGTFRGSIVGATITGSTMVQTSGSGTVRIAGGQAQFEYNGSVKGSLLATGSMAAGDGTGIQLRSATGVYSIAMSDSAMEITGRPTFFDGIKIGPAGTEISGLDIGSTGSATVPSLAPGATANVDFPLTGCQSSHEFAYVRGLPNGLAISRSVAGLNKVTVGFVNASSVTIGSASRTLVGIWWKK